MIRARAMCAKLGITLFALVHPVLAQEQKAPTPPIQLPSEEFSVEDRMLVVLHMAWRQERAQLGLGEQFLKGTGVPVTYAEQIQREFDAETAASHQRVCARRADFTSGAALGRALDEENVRMKLFRRSKLAALDAKQRDGLLELSQRVSIRTPESRRREAEFQHRDPKAILNKVCGALSDSHRRSEGSRTRLCSTSSA